jgi:uncharacterized membrane protein
VVRTEKAWRKKSVQQHLNDDPLQRILNFRNFSNSTERHKIIIVTTLIVARALIAKTTLITRPSNFKTKSSKLILL